MVEDVLEKAGPCLSSELAERLVRDYGISPGAARQRISRARGEVRKLSCLPFRNKAIFVYLRKDYASPWYWRSLYEAIYSTGNAYSLALGAVEASGILPIHHFEISCGAPIAQKKHISAENVLNRLVRAGVLVRDSSPELGDFVMTKEMYDEARCSDVRTRLIAETRSRIFAEQALLEGLKDWLRNLAMASYEKVKIRTPKEHAMVGTLAWGLTAPSYLCPLRTWGETQVKPGFVACDVQLGTVLDINHIAPFLNKVRLKRALKNTGKTIFIHVGTGYTKEAFQVLRSEGVIPATPKSLFGHDVADGFSLLIPSLTSALLGSVSSHDFNELLRNFKHLEGAMNSIRGTCFELLVAEILRKECPAYTQFKLNKKCKGKGNSEAEVDIYLVNDISARIIECKSKDPSSTTAVDDEEIAIFIEKRIPRVRYHLREHENYQGKPRFELWTNGRLTKTSQARIQKTKDVNANKFELVVVGPNEIKKEVMRLKDQGLVTTLRNHFLPEL